VLVSRSGHGILERFIHPDRRSSSFIPKRICMIVASLTPRANEWGK
jgi:hypothetical protein